jgi:hypothetical protein
MTHKVLPHFLRPVYVGNESAQEVVEAWHLEMSKMKRDIYDPAFHVGKYEDIGKRVGGDPSRVGRNASTFLRTLRVNIDLWDLEYPAEYDVSHQIGRQRDIVDPLLKIEKKAGFRLNIELHQKRIRLNLLEQIFPDLRTILQAFEKERANVRITWFTSEWPPRHQRSARAATQHNTTTDYYTVRNNTVLFKSVAIIYIYYFYLIGAGVMPNLAATTAAPLYAHSLRRRLALLTTTTLLFSN